MADHNLAAFYPSLENLFDEKGGLEAQDCRPSFYVGEDLIMKSECLRVRAFFIFFFFCLFMVLSFKKEILQFML